MKDFNSLEEKVRDLLPAVEVVVDAPRDKGQGIWFLDMHKNGVVLTVQFKAPDSWALYNDIEPSIEGYNDWQKVLQRILIIMEKV